VVVKVRSPAMSGPTVSALDTGIRPQVANAPL
jgi:hypothetical protein